MVNIEEARKNIEMLIHSNRDLMWFDEGATVVVRLVFIKYVIDNSIGAKTVEQMQQYNKAQKMFATGNVGSGIDAIVPVLSCVDEAFGLDSILTDREVINTYANELFGYMDIRQKKGASPEMFAEALMSLSKLDLEDNGTHEVGRVYVEALLEAIKTYSYRNSFSGGVTTKSDISRVAKALLDVESTDRFLDVAAGIGLSTLEITKETMPTIVSADINKNVAAVSAMLYIMYGYTDFTVKCADSLSTVIEGIRANKVFVDPPLGVRVLRTNGNDYSDASLAAIDKIMHTYLEPDGIAVVTATSSTLFQSKRTAAGLREELVQLRCLKAVIALPPLWGGSNAGTNLLVLVKFNKNEPVFIDAVEAAKACRPDKQRTGAGDVVISDELIERIVSVVENPVDIEGFSHVSNGVEIREKDWNLVPANYVARPEEEDDTTLAEIDEQLKELYSQLLR